MIEITPTATERAAGRFGGAALQRAVAALQADGFVVINDVVDHAHLDRLQERMSEDLVKIRALPVVPHNFVWGNIQQNPPPDADLVFGDVVANPFVCQVTRALLGSGAFNECLTGNTNVPGSGLQPVHVDEGQLWPNLSVAHPPARLVVNLALSETTEEMSGPRGPAVATVRRDETPYELADDADHTKYAAQRKRLEERLVQCVTE